MCEIADNFAYRDCIIPHLSGEGYEILCQLSRRLLLLLRLLRLVRRTSTASAISQCSPPDPNGKLRIRVIPAGPPPQAPEARISEDIPDRMPERLSEEIR